MAEPPINQQRIVFHPLVNAEQTTGVIDPPVEEPTAVPIASTSDQALPGTQPTPQVDPKSCAKRRIDNINPPQFEGGEKRKRAEK